VSTFKELQDRVLDGSKRAGLTDLVEVKSLVNQAYLEMAALVRPNVTQVVKTLVLDDPSYSIATDWLLTNVTAIRDIRVTDSQTGQNYVLRQVSPQYIMSLQETQQTAGGGMNFYAIEGLDLVTFYPAPSSTTLQATITYVARPVLMVADGDTPATGGIPVEFHDTIVLGALGRSLRVWHPPTAMNYHNSYRAGLQEYRQWLNRYRGARHATAVVQGSRVNTALHDNSRDYSGMR
jgi:hypothetical protein